nr:ribonuclease E inhibitor RraB [Nocardia shimofusensis]
MWRRLAGRATEAQLDPASADLAVVAESFDDAEACSAALDRAAGFDATRPALLRHHLRVPGPQVERVCEIAAQDGYSPAPGSPAPDGEWVRVVLCRTQRVDALHCAQERSRMAGLAQRHEGHADGWDVMQPPASR